MDTVKKKILKLSVVSVVILLSSFTYQTDIFDSIGSNILKNDVKGVSAYFNSSVELTLDNTEGMYSKTQAEVVLKNFLDQHACTGFSITHRGKSGGNNSFAICSYKSATGNYRVTIYVKEMGGKNLIHELKFEKE